MRRLIAASFAVLFLSISAWAYIPISDMFLDTLRIASQSGLTMSVNRPTKAGPIGRAPTWAGNCDHHTFVNVITDKSFPAASRWRMLFDVDVHQDTQMTCYAYADSAADLSDSTVWQYDSLGLVTFRGSTNNNIITYGINSWLNMLITGWTYGIDSGKYTAVSPLRAITSDFKIYSSVTPYGPYSLIKTVPCGGNDNHGWSITRALDGSYRGYYQVTNSDHSLRAVGLVTTADGNLGGTWGDSAKILGDTTSIAAQLHSAFVKNCDSAQIMVTMGYNTDNSTGYPGPIKIAYGRDYQHFTIKDSLWIDKGTGSVYDSGGVWQPFSFTKKGDNWKLYYGVDRYMYDHARPRGRNMGVASIRYRGIGQIARTTAGTGTFTTARYAVSPARKLHVNYTANGSGDSILVQVNDTNGSAIVGYSYGECTPLKGDSVYSTPRWLGRDLSHLGVGAFTLSFQLTKTTSNVILYNYSIGDDPEYVDYSVVPDCRQVKDKQWQQQIILKNGILDGKVTAISYRYKLSDLPAYCKTRLRADMTDVFVYDEFGARCSSYVQSADSVINWCSSGNYSGATFAIVGGDTSKTHPNSAVAFTGSNHIRFYPADEASGDIIDACGIGNGDDSGGVSYRQAVGAITPGISTNGTSGRFAIPDGDDLTSIRGATAVIKSGDYTVGEFLTKGTSAAREWTFRIAGDKTLKATFYKSDATASITRAASTPFTNDSVYHVAFAWNGGTTSNDITLYTNGAVRPSAGSSAGTFTGLTNTATTLLVNKSLFGGSFYGKQGFSSVRLFSVTPTANEIAAYNKFDTDCSNSWTAGVLDTLIHTLVISSVTPASGSSTSEHALSIASSNAGFVGAPVCSLWSEDGAHRYALTAVTNMTDTAYVTAPVMAAHWYKCYARNGDGQADTLDSAYQATQVPILTTLKHPMGRVGYVDTIVGSGFYATGGTATLGGTSVTISRQTNDTLIWTVPTKAKGTYNWIFVNSAGLKDTVSFRVLVPTITITNP